MSDEQLIKTPGVFGENGNFLLERQLGAGGMGGVYMGRDKMLDRPVAVKVMLKEYGSDPEFVEKFKKEAQAAARLIHPNIAQIYSYGISDGMPYIAMELVAGGSLDGLMKTHGAAIDIPRVMKICEQVAQALRCSADQGLVHGDVKPENILLDANGNAKLVDFGLAAMQKDTTEIWGTPYYIAPEKVKKEPVDYRADMYSLGGTIYHALTGVAPFEGEDAVTVVRKRFEGLPKKPSELRPGISPQVDFLVMKMLALKPADRYPTFEALLEDFKKVMAKGLTTTQTVSDLNAKGGSHITGKNARPAAGHSGKHVTIKRPTKKFTVKVPDEAETPASGDETPASGGLKIKPSGIPARFSNSEDGETKYEDEGGGNLGLKVLGVIGAVVLVIAAVIGGLYALTSMNESGNAAEVQAQLDKGFRDLKQNYATLEKEVVKYRETVNTEVTNAVLNCEDRTKQIAKLMDQVYPKAYSDMLRPPKSKELIAAEKSLLEPEEKPAEASADAATNAPPAQATAAKPAAKPAAEVKKFRAPVGDEGDPNSPEGQAYLKEKEEWIAAQKKAAEAPPPEEKPEESSDSPAAEEEASAPVRSKPLYVDKMIELWNSVYEAQVALIAVNKQLDSIAARLEQGNAALNEGDQTEAKLKKLNDLQTVLRDEYKSVTSGTEAETARKIVDTVKSRGNRWLRDCTENVRNIKNEEHQKAAEAAAKAQREKNAEEEKARKAQLIASEVESAKNLFEDLKGHEIMQLGWQEATKRLYDLKAGFKTGEGAIEVDNAIGDVQRMAAVQAILQRNLKGYEFKRKLPKGSKAIPLAGCVVTNVTDDKFTIQGKKKGSKPRDISWRKFYRDYHENLSEVIHTFIRRGDQNGRPKLNRKEQADALLGVGLTLHIICSDDASAGEYADIIIKEAVVKFPAIREDAKRIFPEVDFSALDAETKASDL